MFRTEFQELQSEKQKKVMFSKRHPSLRSPEQGQSSGRCWRLWSVLWSSLELVWQADPSAKQYLLWGIFRAIAEGLLAETDWAFLAKKGSVTPLLASRSHLCASDFRPGTELSVPKESRRLGGAFWEPRGGWQGFRKGSGSRLRHPMSPEGWAPFWIVMGKWNWVFPVLLCVCERRF